MCVVFYFFVTPGHEWKGVSFSFSDLGRPGIIAVRIRCDVVRIHITRGTIAIISIAAKTQAGLPSILSTCLLRFGGRGPSAGLAARRQDFSTPNFDIFFIPFYSFFHVIQHPGACSPIIPLAAGLRLLSRLGQTRHKSGTKKRRRSTQTQYARNKSHKKHCRENAGLFGLGY